MKKTTQPRTVLLVGIASILTSAHLFAGTESQTGTSGAAPSGRADSDWQFDLNTGISLTRGNTDSFGLSIGLDAERRWNGWQVIGKGNYNYSELDSIITGNALRLGLQLNRDLTERWYVGLANTFTYDEIGNLDYRYQVASAFGYRAWTSDRGSLSFEAGPGYSWEKQGGTTTDYAMIRFGERFSYAFSKDARFVQSLEYLPDISDFGRYTLVAEAAITARIVGNLWWRNAIRDIYNTNAPAGLKKNDLQLTTGLSWGLGDPDAGPAPARKVRKKSDVTKPTAAPGRPEGVWQTTASLGLNLMKGNADNMLIAGDITTSMVSKPNEYGLSIGGSYGEVNKVRNLQNFRVDALYNRSLTDRFYLGAGLNYLTDDIADLDYRVMPSGVLGYKLINNDRTSLRLEAGPGYTWERLGGVDSEFFTVVGRERFEHAMSDTSKVWQSAMVQLDPSNTDKYIITAEVGVAFWLTESISVRTVATNIYNNPPAGGRKANDFRMISGIAISF